LEDSFLHKGLRKKLVDEIRAKGITDEKVLAAIGRVPRHCFMESSFLKFSYQDKAFPIGSGQTISQPYTVAFQTQLLEIKPMEKVLEVGTGSGFQTAVLLELSARVYTIERHMSLHTKSQQLLSELGYKANFFFGDGYAGLPSYGPFDKIIVTAGAAEIPTALLTQLRIGGWMIIPLGADNHQIMHKITRTAENSFEQTRYGNFAFVPMLKGTVK
jgi:protein-L-isoaspartate(D-aspartate) O-methyltransferase